MYRVPTPILVLFLVSEQYGFLGEYVTQADGGGAGLRAVKYSVYLRHRLGRLLRRWFIPDRVRANTGLPFGFKQLLFVIHQVFWKVSGQFILMFECDSPGGACRLAVAAEDTAQQIHIEDFRVTFAR